MVCDWTSLLALLPQWLRPPVDSQGKETLQELRLRLGQAPELIRKDGKARLEKTVCQQDLDFVVNAASRYSPWASATVNQGYLTASGGHRVGICGETAVQEGRVLNIRLVRSLCIRVARDFPGLAGGLPETGSLLVVGSPGTGKTTLLRDLIRRRSQNASVAVVDQRGELFPPGFDPGPGTDVLTGCSKPEGIDMVLRTMGPGCIAMDEITADRDCEALIQAAWCGVDLLATAHAASVRDLRSRPIYQKLAQSGIFEEIVIMNRDKSWRRERVYL